MGLDLDPQSVTRAFVLLWAVIDPIGSVPVFIAVTKKHPEIEKKSIALTAVLVAAGLLIFFLVGGRLLLDLMGIPLAAFQVSGGIILFLFALTMLFGESKPEEELGIVRSGRDTAIFPMAIPSIAGPGALMAVILLADRHRENLAMQAAVGGVVLAILGVQFLLLLSAPVIHRWIGDSGASVVSRVMGLLLGAIAANSVLLGIKTYFSI